jgi:Mce-associated membrane protein
VDVAAVRPDELNPDDEPGSDGRRTAPRTPRRALVVGTPFVLLAALLALGALLVAKARDHARLDDARNAALAAARSEAVNLTTIRYTSAAADLDRILAGATGKLHAQFDSERAQFPAVLQRQQSESEGSVLSAAVVSCSDSAGTAQVVVATDANVSTASAAGKRQTVLKHYRMVMHLTRADGRWLVSDVAFAGVPQ